MSEVPRDPAPEPRSEPEPGPSADRPMDSSDSYEPASLAAPPEVVLPREPSRSSGDDVSIASPADRWAHRRAEPRPLAFFWTTLLAVGTVVALAGTTSTGILGQDVYRPAVRTLITVGLVCGCLLWPLFRLSQPPEPIRGTRVALRDLPVVYIPMVALLIPQRLWFLAGWSTGITIALALVILAWLLIVGGLLAGALERLRAGAGGTTRARVTAMLWIVALIAAAPAAALLTAPPNPNADPSLILLASPMTCVGVLVAERPWSGLDLRVEPGHWLGILGLGLGAIASWSRAVWIARALPPPTPPVASFRPSA